MLIDSTTQRVCRGNLWPPDVCQHLKETRQKWFVNCELCVEVMATRWHYGTVSVLGDQCHSRFVSFAYPVP